MMTFKNAPGSTISFLILALLPSLVFGGDVSAGPQDGSRAGIIFEMADSDRLLGEIEMCRIVREENVLRKQLDEIRKEREALLRERIDFLKEQNGELHRLNDATREMAKMAAPKWYEELFQAGKWIGLGILVGVTLHAVK